MDSRTKIAALVFGASLAVAGTAFAGGAPENHGLDGRDFGAAVSGADKGTLSDHVSGGKSGGAPATHGTDGRGFGETVSGADKGALSDHVSGGKAGGGD